MSEMSKLGEMYVAIARNTSEPSSKPQPGLPGRSNRAAFGPNVLTKDRATKS